MAASPFCRLGQIALVVIIVTHSVSTNSKAPTTKGGNPVQVKYTVTLSTPECLAAVKTRFADVDFPELLCGSLDFFQVIYTYEGCVEADFNLLKVKFCQENNTDLEYEYKSNTTLLVSTSIVTTGPTELYTSTVSREDDPVMTSSRSSETPITTTTPIAPITSVTAQNTTDLLHTEDIETSELPYSSSTGSTQPSTTNTLAITEPATEITEPATTSAPEITDPTTTNAPEITKPATTNAPEITDPVTTNAPEITEPATANAPNITEPATINAPEITETAITNAPDIKESTIIMSKEIPAPSNTPENVISTKTINTTELVLDNINCVIENMLSTKKCRQFIIINRPRIEKLTRGCEFIHKRDLKLVDCNQGDMDLLNQILCDNVTVHCPKVPDLEQVLKNITKVVADSCQLAMDSITEDILKDLKKFCESNIKNLVELCTEKEISHVAVTLCHSVKDSK